MPGMPGMLAKKSEIKRHPKHKPLKIGSMFGRKPLGFAGTIYFETYPCIDLHNLDFFQWATEKEHTFNSILTINTYPDGSVKTLYTYYIMMAGGSPNNQETVFTGAL